VVWLSENLGSGNFAVSTNQRSVPEMKHSQTSPKEADTKQRPKTCRGYVCGEQVVNTARKNINEASEEMRSSVLKSSLVRFFTSKRGNWQPQPV
jgi:hypothetical protein